MTTLKDAGFEGVTNLYKTGDKGHLKHGLRKTRLYNIWANIKTRCYNEHDPHFERWGNRGVTMCEEWKTIFNHSIIGQ